jgi:3-dehydroquinate dehydratase-2
MKILIIHGPNLNILGKRNKVIYGEKSLDEINELIEQQAAEIDVDVAIIQANSEGDLVDFIQKEAGGSDGIIINAGALTHYGLSLRDALLDTTLPVIEVHLSNIYAREEFRQRSVIAPIAKGQVTGLGWRGYVAALRTLVADLRGKAWQ